MSKSKFPLYEDEHTFGSESKHYLTGSERFYIDSRYSKYSYLHHHNYAEISYYFEGTGTETINGVSHRLQPGTVSVVLPHHIHIIKWDSDRKLRKFCCFFDIQLLSGMHEDNWFSSMLYGIGTVTPSFIDFTGAESERMRGIFENLLQEYEENDNPGRLQLIRTKLKEAFLLFIRKGLSLRTEPRSASIPSTEETKQLWPLLQFVHAHYNDRLNLSDLSARFFMSVPYISRFFKMHVGIGFVEYLHRLRIERATYLLQHTDMTVTEIAFRVGFDNSRTFSRVFREQKGRSAREYRLQALK